MARRSAPMKQLQNFFLEKSQTAENESFKPFPIFANPYSLY